MGSREPKLQDGGMVDLNGTVSITLHIIKGKWTQQSRLIKK